MLKWSIAQVVEFATRTVKSLRNSGAYSPELELEGIVIKAQSLDNLEVAKVLYDCGIMQIEIVAKTCITTKMLMNCDYIMDKDCVKVSNNKVKCFFDILEV